MKLDEIVRRAAARVGIAGLTAGDIEHVIWSETGYPCFWPRPEKSPQENFLAQVDEFFARLRPVKKGRGQRRNRRNRP